MTLADTAAAAASVGRPAATIRTWARRGLLTRHGRDQHGRTLYDLDEVHSVAVLQHNDHMADELPGPGELVEVDTATAAFMVGVPVHTIRNWASRGHLQPLRTEGTKTIYDAEAVARTAARFGHLPELRPEDRDCCIRSCNGSSWAVLGLPVCQSHALAIWLNIGDELKRRATSGEDGPAQPPPRDLQPVVYFIQSGDLIKIGTTTRLRSRLSSISSSSPRTAKILLAVAGDRSEEDRVHALFAEERIRGEWFRPSQRLLDFINDRRDQDVRSLIAHW